MCMHKVIQILEKLFILSRCTARIPKLVSTLPVFHELMAKKAKNACMAFECTFNWHLSHNQLSAIPLKVWTMNAKTPMIIYSMFVTSCWPCHRLKSHTCLNKLHGFISALTTGVWHVWRKTKGDRRLVTDTQAMHNCTCLKCDNIYDNLIKHVCDESEASKNHVVSSPEARQKPKNIKQCQNHALKEEQSDHASIRCLSCVRERLCFLRVFNKCTLITRFAWDISSNQMWRQSAMCYSFVCILLYRRIYCWCGYCFCHSFFYYSCFAVRMFSMRWPSVQI